MKSTMKKIAASLMALLMMIQLVPALAATYSSGMIVGSAEGYKEALAIVASKGTYVLLGQNLVLDVNEDYEPNWETSNAGAATIDANGVVTAVAEGTATMTATIDRPTRMTDSIEVTVIDPGVVIAEEEKPEGEDPENPEGEDEEKPEGEDEENPEGEGEEQTKVSADNTLVIVINGENEHVVYDGEEHLLDRYVATANNEELFDETKIKVEGEIGVTGVDCGFYELALDGLKFTYEDEEVAAHFVVNNSFLKITPAPVTVAVEPAEKAEGDEDPEFTATITGLCGEDTEDMIAYTLSRDEGEEVGSYMINAEGEEVQGNYKVEFIGNVLTITEKVEEEEVVEAAEGEETKEKLEPLAVRIFSLHPTDQPVYFGTEITLEAQVTGAAEGEYTIQWQYSKDLESWIDVPGANDVRYTFVADGETITYAWRVVAERIQKEVTQEDTIQEEAIQEEAIQEE